jgi:hypothetical protein
LSSLISASDFLWAICGQKIKITYSICCESRGKLCARDGT